CRMNTENAIRSVKGVKKASVDLQSGTAEVVYVPAKVSPEEIAAAVDAIGFKAGIV
ncbi:MAG: heavy-metal-associated domain-containing protein, partial [Clostridia bacterium]|nr:heavy-metal-associated domain-containing protein [Clostridia bacterium]